MNINFRMARADDIDSIATYIKMAAGGISEFLLHDLLPDTSTEDLIKLALNDDNTPYHFSNVIVAETEDSIAGAVNFYPSKEHGIPDIMRSFVPEDRLAALEHFLNSRVENSLYIHALAVNPDYRNTAIALDLCKCCEALAKEAGLDFLSAHVWLDNTPVVMALKMAGFEVIENIDIKKHPLLPHQGGMVLLRSQPLHERLVS